METGALRNNPQLVNIQIEEKKGKSWMEMRRAFAFNGKFIIPTLDSLCSILSSPTLYFITAVKGLHYLRGLL